MQKSVLDINDRLGEHPPSWYAATANELQTFASAAGDLKFDVLIIGAGYSGLSAALHLAQLGYKTGVVEAHRIGWGASGRNGGQVGTGQRVEIHDLERQVGKTAAKDAFDIGVDATDLVRDLINKHKIDCNYVRGIIEAFHKTKYNREAKEEVDHYRERYGYKSMTYLPPEALREKVNSPDLHGGIVDTNTGHLHPLNYAKGLAKAAVKAGAEIFELSRVTSIETGQVCVVKTSQARISAMHVVLATNGYLENLDREVAARVMPINNFIVATEPLEPAICDDLIRDREAVCDTRFVVNYFRLSQDNRLLFGGGETYSYRFPSDIVGLVRPRMEKTYPQLKGVRIDYAWGGTLAITVNRLPLFEFRQNGIVNISGYSGSGVHMATMAGRIVAEAIDGQMARFDVMSGLPTPSFPGGSALRWPLLPLAMTWYALRDRL